MANCTLDGNSASVDGGGIWSDGTATVAGCEFTNNSSVRFGGGIRNERTLTVTGCNFGPDGALYAADWQGGYPLKEKGAVWKIDDPKEAGSAMRREVAALLK